VDLDTLPTEQHRPELLDLDLRPSSEQVALMLADQRQAVEAVAAVADQLARAVDAVVARLRGTDGRMIHVGAGTAGRLGLLDASECPPTFDTERVLAVMAGGGDAFGAAREAIEDDATQAAADLAAVDVRATDVVVGVAASGRTPYTVAAVTEAGRRGALTVAVVGNPGSPLAAAADIAVEAVTGPELIAGSTRLKAGTAQKVVLNTLSTLVLVQLGHTFGNLMVDVRSTNAKLRDRARRMVADATGTHEAAAEVALDAADGDHKVAIVALLADVDPATARTRLQATGGRIRTAIGGGS
jgi:N-acetylmuramic acid 6-phosphate etherase